jgi:hypothetical protein
MLLRNVAKGLGLGRILWINMLVYEYEFCQTYLTRTDSIKDQGIFVDSKLFFHNHVSCIFYYCIKFWGLVQSVTLNFLPSNVYTRYILP